MDILTPVSHRQRDGDRQRQVWREFWQPVLFLLHLQGIRRVARQSYGHLVTEVKGPVVPAAERNRRDGKIRPLGKLGGDQPAYECHVDFHGFGNHFVCQGIAADQDRSGTICLVGSSHHARDVRQESTEPPVAAGVAQRCAGVRTGTT